MTQEIKTIAVIAKNNNKIFTKVRPPPAFGCVGCCRTCVCVDRTGLTGAAMPGWAGLIGCPEVGRELGTGTCARW